MDAAWNLVHMALLPSDSSSAATSLQGTCQIASQTRCQRKSDAVCMQKGRGAVLRFFTCNRAHPRGYGIRDLSIVFAISDELAASVFAPIPEMMGELRKFGGAVEGIDEFGNLLYER